MNVNWDGNQSTLVIWHIAGKPYNWLNFIWIKNMKGNRGNEQAQSKFLL